MRELSIARLRPNAWLARRGGVRAGDSSSSLFAGVRVRLTLWYTGVLGIALVLFGLTLYVSVRHELLSPVDDQLHLSAETLSDTWVAGGHCPAAVDLKTRALLYVCYQANGKLDQTSRHNLFVETYSPDFLQGTLAQQTLRRASGTATDTVDVSTSESGVVKRLALAVRDDRNRVIGAVMLGADIGDELNALDVLKNLLLALGAVTLLLATGGGLFLAHRALQPARVAYSRQRDFIADASHELRTPLAILRADAEVLLRGRDRFDADDVLLLEDVVAEAGHMSLLADNMLNLARLDAGRMRIEQEVVDLSRLAHDMAHRVQGLAAESDVTVDVRAPRPVLVVGDHLLIDQALLVLVDNAIKYNRPGGTVTICVQSRGLSACVEVRDTGIGIEPEHLVRLGERFYRVDKARSRRAGGAGLGVSIAQSIAARHGGSLHLSSEPGSGTVAVLSLPEARRSEEA